MAALTIAAILPAWALSSSNDSDPEPSKVRAQASHESSEGQTLAVREGETPLWSEPCEAGAKERLYDVVALALTITLNRFGDADPDGRTYALTSRVAAIRDEESRNRKPPGAVSLGLQGDAIQPLTLRARPGECLRVRLRNDLREPASLHVHGVPLRVRGGGPAIATNPAAMAAPGATVEYEWRIPGGEPEATHYFHSHGNAREQTGHGLFGALVVEPRDARWTDPRTGAEATGWDAIIDVPGGTGFREFVLYYHEIGHENYLLRNASGGNVPLVDPLLGSYRPGARAINYRSEPFFNRMELQRRTTGRFDESLAYSSYAFGDPATPVLRSYLGEPTKQRVVHGGSEVNHVHHVHGGSVRWPRRPGLDRSRIALGLTKKPDLLPGRSERTDSQSLGPSETFDVEHECGAGGCQGSVGDFLIHCHVAHHYFAGMWGIWRVYNTLQTQGAQTDLLPPLRALGGSQVVAAVDSSKLAGATVTHRGRSTTVSDPFAWAAALLPARGVPSGYDASVLDWSVDGAKVLGEPGDPRLDPGSRSRPPLLFDPRTGSLAYPFLRPHLGKRPPFAPGNGPAPFLEPGHDLSEPGAAGPGSLCPAGTRRVAFTINAVNLPVPLNARMGLTDPDGMLYVLAEQEAALRRDPSLRSPLVIRANAQQDCVDVVLASSLPDAPINRGFSKVNLHIHFVQFDVQASDGVVAGFNYEQSVRPYTVEGAVLRDAASAGATTLALRGGAARFKPGATIGIGLGTATFESRRVARVAGDTVHLDRPLSGTHAAGEHVSTEFVRHRWYPDAQTGTAYFHDHVNALESWRHGLFGALVVEPPGSTYHDPRTGAALRSGAIADIHTDAESSADVRGSFREAVLMLMDDVPITSDGRGLGGAINMRAEPLRRRDGFDVRGSPPATPLIEATLGDPIVLRTLVTATNDVHTFRLDGHWFRAEPHDSRSPPVSAVHIGISERFDLHVPSAGGPQRMAGDYRYGAGRLSKLGEGAWGLLRVHAPGRTPLRPLPGRAAAPNAAGDACPSGAKPRRFDVSAVDAPSLQPPAAAPGARVLVAASDKQKAETLAARAEPLVLRAALGDCIEVRFANHTSKPVEPAADLLAYDPASRAPVAPGGTATLRLYATPEMGERVAMLRDAASVEGLRAGLFGAIVIGPRGVRYTDPRTGKEVSTGAIADAVAGPGSAWRDVVVFPSDDDAGIGTHQMPYSTQVRGVASFGYRSDPLAPRRDEGKGFASPATATMRAHTGDPMRIHVVAAVSEQPQVFALEGHRWEPRQAGRAAGSEMLGGGETLTIRTAAGPMPGSYLYANHREPYRDAGMWGLLRVADGCGGAALRPLPGSDHECGFAVGRVARPVFVVAAIGVLLFAGARRRARRSP